MLKIKHPLRVVCAGVRRSGSTWLYNILKFIFKENQYEVKYDFVGHTDWFTSCLSQGETKIAKVHKYNQEIAVAANYIFGTTRDFRDIAASAVRRNRLQHPEHRMTVDSGDRPDLETLEGIKMLLNGEKKNWESWSNKCNLVIKYEDIVNCPTKAIGEISNCLKLPVDPKTVLEKVNALKVPKITVDKETELWPHHITDGRIGSFADTLKKEVVEMIEKEYAAYV